MEARRNRGSDSFFVDSKFNHLFGANIRTLQTIDEFGLK